MDELGRSGSGPAEDLRADIRASLQRICILLHRHTGHDFSHYKESTLVRRIQWRLHAQHAASVTDYISNLERDPREAEILFKGLLIGVTSFFRDEEVFALLARQVIPMLLKDREPDAPLRIWVPGCASGEEAYSIAMLVQEHLSDSGTAWPVQIFATDIDEEALLAARRGRYSEEAVAHLPPERLARFFTRDGAFFQAGKDLRERCIFSPHNLIKDPPFSGLDLISCRNLLIYLEADLQKKLVPLFHYALRPGGCLLLGPSEGLATHPELFITLDKKCRLFQRSEDVVRPFVEFPLSQRTAALSPARTASPELLPPARQQQAIGQAFERMILEEYAPPCAVVNLQGDILYVAGRTGRYLQPPAGAFSNNLITLVPGHLKMELRSALHKAARTRRRVVREDVAVEIEGRVRQLRLTVRPMPGPGPESGLYAVIWQETGAPRDLDSEEADAPAVSPDEPVVQHLESELRTAREELQTAVEEVESSNEELKAANEELISTNEELQSANEELRASQEELSLANDELERALEQRRLALEAAELGTWDYRIDTGAVFWDERCRNMWGIPEGGQIDYAAAIAGIHPDDRTATDEAVTQAISGVRNGAYHQEFRVVWPDGSVHWVASHGRVYFKGEGADRRAFRFIGANRDITEARRAQEALRQSERRYGALFEGMEEGVAQHRLIRDARGVAVDYEVLDVNPAYEAILGLRRAQVIGKRATELYGTPEAPYLAEYARVVETGIPCRFQTHFAPRDQHFLISCVSPAPGVFATIFRDITEQQRAEEILRRYELLVQQSRDIILFLRRDDGRILEANAAATAAYGYSREELLGLTVRDLRAAEALGLTSDHMAQADAHGILVETVHRRRDGSTFPVEVSSRGATVGGGRVLISMIRDITERKQAEEAMRQSEARFHQLFEQAPVPYQSLDADGCILDANAAWLATLGYARHEAVGRWFGDFLVPAEQDLFRTRFPVFKQRGEIHGAEFQMRRKDGAVILGSFEGRIGRDEIGNFKQTHCIFADVTQRKRAEETSKATIELLSLCNQAECLRELMRSMTAFFQQLTACEAVGVRLRQGNEFPYFETRGLPPEFVAAESQLCARDPAGELVRDSAGHPVLECMCGNVLCGRFDCSKPFFSERGSFWTNSTSELLACTAEAGRLARTRNRCNGEGYESVALVPIRVSGQIVGLCQFNSRQKGRFSPERIQLLEQMADYVGIAVAKLRAEEALRESEQRLRLALESGQMGLWEWDVRTNQSVWNDQEYGLLGLPAGDEQVPTDLFFRHVHPEDAPRLNRALADVLRDGTALHDEFRVIRADGELRWLAAIARVLRDAGGQPLRMLGVNYDITERKRAEEAARMHQMEIAHLSRVASVGEMASSVAHELNQPLTAILGYAEACLNAARSRPDLPAKTIEHLREVSNEANRAAGIVRRMRNYVRKEPPAKQPRDINPIVREAVDLVRHDMQRSGVTPRLRLAEGLPPVFVDSVGIQQVLINLLQNALDAMQGVSRADRSLGIETRAAEEGIQVSVADTGLAAAPEVMDRIFVSFFTTKPNGLGLGLSICRTIIEAHGGRISAAANRDRGMTFTFALPAISPV